MQKWKITGIDGYYVNNNGVIIREQFVTDHMHYKAEREIKFNSRNQVRLFRNGKYEYWSKKQLRPHLVKL